MLTWLTKDLNYKQVTIVRSLLFSLVLLIAMQTGLIGKWFLNTYLILFILRLIFNYDLEMLKDKWFPFVSLLFMLFTGEGFYVDDEWYDTDDLFDWNLDDMESEEYIKKTSLIYIICFIVVNMLSMAVTIYPKIFILYTILAYMNTKLSFTIYAIVLVGALLVYLVHLLMATRDKKQKKKLKVELDV